MFYSGLTIVQYKNRLGIAKNVNQTESSKGKLVFHSSVSSSGVSFNNEIHLLGKICFWSVAGASCCRGREQDGNIKYTIQSTACQVFSEWCQKEVKRQLKLTR